MGSDLHIDKTPWAIEMPLAEFIKKFSRLNTDRGRHHWPSNTYYSEFHKPFLLLFIMDLICPNRGMLTPKVKWLA